MKHILIFILPNIFIQAYGQIENRLQPDSVYQNRKVKKVYAYLNSKKDLSEIIEFDREGRKIRSVKYSASYNKETRKAKRIDMISRFKYDSQMKLIQIIDTIDQDSSRINNYYFYYSSTGVLNTIKYYQGKFETPVSETYYQTNPYQSTTIRKNDSLITYNMTTEYDKDFFVNKSYGYDLQPKLKSRVLAYKGDTSILQYSDYSDMQRFEDTVLLKNTFNSKGQLITSTIRSVFMTNRVLDYKLTYKYYPNGLLKSIRGYIQEFFKYEFYE